MSLDSESTGPSPRRILVFRILAVLTGAFFLLAGLTNARAGWMVVAGASGDLHPELNRWFTTVAGTSDLIFAGCLMALAWRPKLPLLFFYIVVSFVIAAAVNLPFVPLFAVILAAVVPVMVAFPYWSELRGFTTWWRHPHVVMLTVSVVAASVVIVLAGIAVSRQIGGSDAAAQANWWADYAEHVSLLGVAAFIASSGRPGWRILGGLAAAAWLYLGFVAAVALPDQNGSWQLAGGFAGVAVGLVLAVTCARGDAPEWDVRRQTSSLEGG
jgi:hypothetical protein